MEEDVTRPYGPFQRAQDPDVERKQRAREYRVAARREKRNRKADEKKQRKLNATILRRMTRNPDKYNKNAERNRLRAIELERRQIYVKAVHQAQDLAAIHDPSGISFNVDPVVKLEDGSVITRDALKRRREKEAERLALAKAKLDNIPTDGVTPLLKNSEVIPVLDAANESVRRSRDSLHPDRILQIGEMNGVTNNLRLSKKQQKRSAIFEPKPPPPRPTIPADVRLPEGEENWLALWDLTDDQIERRVLREKKRKASERKALRSKQQSGKAERRAARDEKRRVYRDIKLEWKAIKEEQTRERTRLKSMEDEESKKIAVRIASEERQAALELCRQTGYTIENTPGTDDIKPKALGMKGNQVDYKEFDLPDHQGNVRSKNFTSVRVDLGQAPSDEAARFVPNPGHLSHIGKDDFIRLDVGDEDKDYTSIQYNHKLRRKIRRAIENAEMRKEMLVREQAMAHFRAQSADAPAILGTSLKPVNVKGHRILENGMLETSKRERVRTRVELTEFNIQMKVLRKQAKDAAIYAGLKVHAELSGRIQHVSDTRDSRPGDGDSSLL